MICVLTLLSLTERHNEHHLGVIPLWQSISRSLQDQSLACEKQDEVIKAPYEIWLYDSNCNALKDCLKTA